MISVIIPTYNRSQMLLRAVRSVLSQTYRNFELIVVDDGSTEVLTDAQRLVEDEGQTWLCTENGGVAAARNFGVSQSCGKWIAFLDSDDSWVPKKLEQQVKFHQKNPQYLLSQCEELWTRNGKRVNKKKQHRMARGYAFSDSLKICCISPSSVMIERQLFEQLGGFDVNMRVCEDYDLWLRITADNEIGYIPEPLVLKFGGHGDQLSKSIPAIDRYRVYSLLKLVTEQQLKDEQLLLAYATILEKAEILQKGAEKHAPEMVGTYRRLVETVSSFDQKTEIGERCSVLRMPIFSALFDFRDAPQHNSAV